MAVAILVKTYRTYIDGSTRATRASDQNDAVVEFKTLDGAGGARLTREMVKEMVAVLTTTLADWPVDAA